MPFVLFTKATVIPPKSSKLPSRSFLVLHITFRSMILSYFVKDIKFVSRFLFLQVDVQFSKPFIEKTMFVLLYCLCSFVKEQLIIVLWIYFWVLYFIPLIYRSTLSSVSQCLDYYSLIVNHPVRQCQSTNFIFLL